MNYKRIGLALIVGTECILACYCGYKIYFNLHQKQNVLGAAAVTPLKKEYLIFPQEASYSAYFEPRPDVIETNTFPWSATGSATYTINGDGLNNRFNYQIQKPQGTYRIIALGDSFTFGHYVNTADNWPSRLEDELNQKNSCPLIQSYEVLNLGVRGYDIDFAAERYRLRGQKYNPDLVIWFINNSHFYEVRQLITQREVEIDAQMSQKEKARYQAEGNYFPGAQLAIEEMFKKYPLDHLVEQENAGLYEFAGRYDGQLVIVANKVEDKYMALLKIFKNFRTAPTYIFQDITDITSMSNAVFPDGHPTPSGHRIYSNEIYQYLESQHLLCQLIRP